MKMKPPVEKNEYYDVTFEDLTHEGAGVAKVQGFPIFVPNALPEEKAQIKVTRVKKGFAFGRLIEMKKKARIERTPHVQSTSNAEAASFST